MQTSARREDFRLAQEVEEEGGGDQCVPLWPTILVKSVRSAVAYHTGQIRAFRCGLSHWPLGRGRGGDYMFGGLIRTQDTQRIYTPEAKCLGGLTVPPPRPRWAPPPRPNGAPSPDHSPAPETQGRRPLGLQRAPQDHSEKCTKTFVRELRENCGKTAG